MQKETCALNQAIGLFYATGVIIAAGLFLFFGISTGKWVASFIICLSCGIGFGLLMHAVVTTLTALKTDLKCARRESIQ